MAEKDTLFSSGKEPDDPDDVAPISTQKSKPKTKAQTKPKVLTPEGIRALTRYLGIKKPFLCYTLKPNPNKPGEFKKVPWPQWKGTETKEALSKLDYWNACWQRVQSGEYSGVGIALFDGLIGFDFDYCLDDDQELVTTHPYVTLIKKLMRTGAYMEVSPSGRGLHGFGYVDPDSPQEAFIRTDPDNSHTKIEVYVQGRFFTVTGNVWKGCEGLEPVNLTKLWMDLWANDKKHKPAAKKQRVGQNADLDKTALKTRKRKVKRDLLEALEDIPSDTYAIWLEVRHSLIDFGLEFDCLDEAKEMWLEWSSKGQSFGGDDVEGPKWDADVPKTEALWNAGSKRKHYQGIFELVKDYRPEREEEDDELDEDDEEGDDDLTKEREKPSSVTITREDRNFYKAHPIRFIIENYLYPNVRVLQAEGGVGKTFSSLHEIVHIILGLPYAGREIIQSGPCLFVTKEDDKQEITETMEAILRDFRVDGDKKLTQAQKDKVWKNFHLIDCVGKASWRLVKSKYGQLSLTAFANDIIEDMESKGVKPISVVFDPAIGFSAGEAHMNDGANMLIEAGRKIMVAFKCLVTFIHHVSQDAARSGREDQTAGRGPTAFPDGARMVTRIKAYRPRDTETRGDTNGKPEEWDKYCEPLQFGEVGIVMIPSKLKKVPAHERKPIYWVREGFNLREAELCQFKEGEASADSQENEEDVVLNLLRKAEENGERLSFRKLRDKAVESFDWAKGKAEKVINRLWKEKKLITREGDQQTGFMRLMQPDE